MTRSDRRSRWFGRGRERRAEVPAAPGAGSARAAGAGDGLLVEEYDGLRLLRTPDDDTLDPTDLADLVRALAGEAEHTVTVVAGAGATRAAGLWTRLGAVLSVLRDDRVETVRLVMSGTGGGRPDRPALARRLADGWKLTVIAPDGPVFVVPGGTLFAHGSWWRFAPGAEPDRLGARQPAPDWQPAVEALPARTDGGYLIDPIPAGVLARSGQAAAPRPGDLCYAVPVDPRGPLVLLGMPEDEDILGAEVSDLLGELPTAVRSTVRLAPGGPRDVLRTGQAVAERLGAGVVVYTGLPFLAPGAGGGPAPVRSVLVGADGEPKWRPFVDSVMCLPPAEDGTVPAPRLLRWESPVAGEQTGTGVVRLSEHWQATVTRAGLYISGTEGEPSPVHQPVHQPVDAESPTIEIGRPGEELDASLWPVLSRVLASLWPDVRRRVRLYIRGTCLDGGAELRRMAAEHDIRAVRFTVPPLPAPRRVATVAPVAAQRGGLTALTVAQQGRLAGARQGGGPSARVGAGQGGPSASAGAQHSGQAAPQGEPQGTATPTGVPPTRATTQAGGSSARAAAPTGAQPATPAPAGDPDGAPTSAGDPHGRTTAQAGSSPAQAAAPTEEPPLPSQAGGNPAPQTVRAAAPAEGMPSGTAPAAPRATAPAAPTPTTPPLAGAARQVLAELSAADGLLAELEPPVRPAAPAPVPQTRTSPPERPAPAGPLRPERSPSRPTPGTPERPARTEAPKPPESQPLPAPPGEPTAPEGLLAGIDQSARPAAPLAATDVHHRATTPAPGASEHPEAAQPQLPPVRVTANTPQPAEPSEPTTADGPLAGVDPAARPAAAPVAATDVHHRATTPAPGAPEHPEAAEPQLPPVRVATTTPPQLAVPSEPTAADGPLAGLDPEAQPAADPAAATDTRNRASVPAPEGAEAPASPVATGSSPVRSEGSDPAEARRTPAPSTTTTPSPSAGAGEAHPAPSRGPGISPPTELPERQRPPTTGELPERSRLPVPEEPPVPFHPGHISTEDERLAFRELAEDVWERHGAAVARALIRMPALRAQEQEAARADVIALHIYLNSPDGPLAPEAVVRGLRSGDERLLPYVACLASALRRMPSYRGVAVRGAGDVPLDGLAAGTLLRDPAPLGAVPVGAGGPPPGGPQYVIWSATGRRVRQLADRPSDGAAVEQVLFAPGTRLRVLDVRPSGPAPLIMLRELPAAAPGTPGASLAPRPELDDVDRAVLARLDDTLRGRIPTPGAFAWPGLCHGPIGPAHTTPQAPRTAPHAD
ncbi:hypothetical protein [Streptomyces sp. NPDC000618]|uniref:hypothetical protein n=1 Tax=Streptomyces sp. NPDC000618 TaxID=3154265 RepID=UPI00331BA0C3